MATYRIAWVEYHSRIIEADSEDEAYEEVGEVTDESMKEMTTTEVTEVNE